MSKVFQILFLVFILALQNCASQTNEPLQLDAAKFKKQIETEKSINVIDVRTPEEFAKGYIKNAKNIDWNGDNFDAEIAKLDKKKTLYVYCLSGGRSASAAKHLREKGFKKVKELVGGIMAWKNANFPLVTPVANAPKDKITQEAYNLMISESDITIIDFYAPWCAPCQRMKPAFEKLENDKTLKNVLVKRINYDENPELAKKLNVKTLPTILVYKNGVLKKIIEKELSEAEIFQLVK